MRVATLVLSALLACGLIVQAAVAGEPVRFTAMDDTTVRVYFASKPVVWTGLTPQQAKNFQRGKPVPAGVPRSALPRDLLTRLPTRRGFAYVRVGADVALIDTSTGVVVDVIENIFG